MLVQNGGLQRQVPRDFEPVVQQPQQARFLRRTRRQGQPMTNGVVTKIVRSFGSEWGRVRTAKTGVDCFFNRASMLHPADFETLSLGQEVTFESEPDMVNGSRAERLKILKPRAKASL